MLSIPEEKTALEPVKFSVEAGLVPRLGAESVSDSVLAVVELVKNSYDDDAKRVLIELNNLRTGRSSIIVNDDGNGMSKTQLQNSCMRIATSGKMKEPLSPIFKRHRLGQKGVGRFAIENLSRKLSLQLILRILKKDIKLSLTGTHTVPITTSLMCKTIALVLKKTEIFMVYA